MQVDDIRRLVNRRWIKTLTSTEGAEYISAALREYSRWNPYVKEAGIQTVLNQYVYDLPSDCIGLKEVRFYPREHIYTVLSAEQELVRALRWPETQHLWSQRVIDDINKAERRFRNEGYYTIWRANRQLLLYPVPAGETVEITYYALHTIEDDACDTIPDEDIDLIVGLVLADLIETEAIGYALDPDYAEGLEKVTVSKIPQNAILMADRMTRRLKGKYGGTAAIAD